VGVTAETLSEVAARFEEGLDELAGTIAVRMRTEIDEVRDLEAPELWAEVRRLNRESRAGQAAHLRRGRTLPDSMLPADADAARAAARFGLSLASALQAFRIGHNAAWERWLNVIAATEMSERDRNDCLLTVSRFVDAYDDRVMVMVAEEYERELDRGRRHGELHRLRIVRELIEGARSSADGLGYDLDLEHVAVIAWGEEPQKALQELSRSLDRRLLQIEAEDQLILAWLGGRQPLSEERRRSLFGFDPGHGTALAFGTSHPGVEGFRRSHREAGGAHLVASRRGTSVTLYEDVALEAFALRDESAARDFVVNELAPLSGSDERSARYRSTLRTYFAKGQNASSAAATLGIHEATVTRHLRQIEQLIGCPVNQRRAELELALRLHDLVDHSGPQPDA
jgi:DNA-binding PucR family transcriptional regulator